MRLFQLSVGTVLGNLPLIYEAGLRAASQYISPVFIRGMSAFSRRPCRYRAPRARSRLFDADMLTYSETCLFTAIDAVALHRLYDITTISRMTKLDAISDAGA